MKINEIRKKLNEDSSFKITVIKKNGKIVCRHDIGSPRNCRCMVNTLNAKVQRILNVKTTPNIYHGKKGIYSNWWIEAIIEEDPDENYHKENWVKECKLL